MHCRGRVAASVSQALRAPLSAPSASASFGTLSETLIKREKRSAAQTYHPLPVVWTRAKGCSVWDVDGKEYLDFLASYRCVQRTGRRREAKADGPVLKAP